VKRLARHPAAYLGSIGRARSPPHDFESLPSLALCPLAGLVEAPPAAKSGSAVSIEFDPPPPARRWRRLPGITAHLQNQTAELKSFHQAQQVILPQPLGRDQVIQAERFEQPSKNSHVASGQRQVGVLAPQEGLAGGPQQLVPGRACNQGCVAL